LIPFAALTMSISKKKILILENSLYPTGAFRSIFNMVSLLKDVYSFCFAISPQSSLADSLNAAGYPVYHIPFLELSRSPGTLIRYLPRLAKNARALLKVIDAEQVDIIHINDLYNLLGVTLKGFRRSLPLVYHVRLLRSSYIGSLYGVFSRLVKRYADRIICVSPPVLEDLGRSHKASIIYDGIQPQERLPAWNGLCHPKQAHILYLGNIVRGKGQQWGLIAFADAARHYPHITLEFSGGVHSDADAAFRDELKALALSRGVGDKVSFTGPTLQVEQKMKEADIVLNMSESESFSMVCLEAMMYGVPLIASDCGGPRDITDGGNMAALVPNKSVEAAAGAILHLLRHPDEGKKKAAAAKTYAAEKYALAKSAAQLKAIYQAL
jgi:glycosyltransferase involved in cell wall biosynthesis